MPLGEQPVRSSAALGAVIRHARAGRYTLAQLAQRAGVSSGLLSLVERGRGNPSLQTLERIAHALDVAVVELLIAADEHAVPAADAARPRGSLVPPDGSIALQGGGRQGDSEAPAPAVTGWQTSMVLGRGQEARVRVLDGSLELSLRETQEPVTPGGWRQPLAVDLEVRTSVEPEPGFVEIPPVNDPRWMAIVNGSIPFQPTTLAARMLFTHVTRCIEHDPSSPNVDRWVSELRGYFVKYEAVSKPELKRIFG